MSEDTTATADSVPVEKLTRVFIKMRDKRAELKAAFDAEDKALSEKMDAIKGALLDYCKEHGVESVRTAAGLFFRGVKTRYWTNDWESMNAFILEHKLPEFYEKRLNQSVVKQFLEDNPDLCPPGLNTDSEYTITVRKK
jgi:hypothetical protein